jgi:histidine triad (HIT) family protein
MLRHAKVVCNQINAISISLIAEIQSVINCSGVCFMSKDLFLKIISRQIPADIVYETDDVLAFRDINPQAPVHILVIPKQHIATTDDLTSGHEEIAGKMMLAAAEIARREGLSEKGYRLVMNCKEHGGQMVYHIHMHLMGGRQLGWPPG